MKNYEVKVDYMKFVFDDRGEAMDFAEMALSHSIDDDVKDVSVRIIREEEV